MGLPWLFRGDLEGHLRDFPSCFHGASMGNPWGSMGLWRFHGDAMVLPWCFHGAFIVRPWSFREMTMRTKSRHGKN